MGDGKRSSESEKRTNSWTKTVTVISSKYICRRCRDIGPFFWKISQYLGSGWHNWSPNVATVTGWTKCFTEEVPDRYVFDICNCICLLFCNLLGEFTVIVLELIFEKPSVWVNVSACYKMYSIVQRVYPLTVDSLLSPGTLSIAFVIFINYFTPKISNETRHIYRLLKYNVFLS